MSHGNLVPESPRAEKMSATGRAAMSGKFQTEHNPNVGKVPKIDQKVEIFKILIAQRVDREILSGLVYLGSSAQRITHKSNQ